MSIPDLMVTLDALEWLEDMATPESGCPEAVTVLRIFRDYERKENSVLGMCLARRPHAEIRDFLLAETLPVSAGTPDTTTEEQR